MSAPLTTWTASPEALADLVADRYGLHPATVLPGPRQFVAETFVLSDAAGPRWFCKVTFKRLFVPAIVASLPALARLSERFPAQIAGPVATLHGGLHVNVPGGIVVLYDFADGEVSYGYDRFAFGALTARIHLSAASVGRDAPQIEFDGAEAVEFIDWLQRAAGSDRGTLNEVAYRHLARFEHFARIFLSACEECRNRAPSLLLTHGDAPGNVVVRAADDFTIVDWDELLLAPAERDLWVLEHEPDVLRGYLSERPDFTIDPAARLHSILRYLFNAGLACRDEIAHPTSEGAVELGIAGIDGLLDGWMSRLLGPLQAESGSHDRPES